MLNNVNKANFNLTSVTSRNMWGFVSDKMCNLCGPGCEKECFMLLKCKTDVKIQHTHIITDVGFCIPEVKLHAQWYTQFH